MVKYLKITLSIALLVLFANDLKAQEIIKEFKRDSLKDNNLASLRSRFGNNKVLSTKYENQMLIALSYFPELKDTKIKFRIKNSTTPLTTRPTLYSMFRSAKKRTYIITISEKSTKYLDTILLKKLNYNAQIGVLGHELCHVSDYLNKGFSKMWNVVVIEIFSKRAVDKFEFNTDLNCINHGLGYQLLDWSINVRENLKRANWLGPINLTTNKKKERYMNPSTIKDFLSTNILYQ
ncbi:hypothetical protein [Flavobacterium soyangense]|uniref:Secretory protein n=1 Tax=Flavobacterium soyangense TaxID=2023265 RepID=A0A930Y051_9FLAO|nr:hypothetical protein [Flavobacterium soyangense]MBF2709593.1 hypothetical protein [Flavobacterium soyangense]